MSQIAGYSDQWKQQVADRYNQQMSNLMGMQLQENSQKSASYANMVSNFDNKLMNYRRCLGDQNRHYDMLAYQGKMRDLQDKIRRGERLEDILHRSNRENVQDQRFQDEKAWRKKQFDKNNRRWNLLTIFAGKMAL